jgi:hypothetical protein
MSNNNKNNDNNNMSNKNNSNKNNIKKNIFPGRGKRSSNKLSKKIRFYQKNAPSTENLEQWF